MAGYPPLTWAGITRVYGEGVAPGEGGRLEAALAVVQAGLDGAFAEASRAGLDPLMAAGARWEWLAALALVGLIGRAGLWLLVPLLPLVALQAADAPERYYWFAWPAAYLAVARGAAPPPPQQDPPPAPGGAPPPGVVPGRGGQREE